MMNIWQERRELRNQKIARSYVSDAVNADRNKLLEFFVDTRRIEKHNIIKVLDGIRYSKPWPKGTSNDDAFDLAIMEAIAIVEQEMK
jgi:hypothetical protein